MGIFNHLISWHNEQIAMSRKLRPRETKQREEALPLIKKRWIWLSCVCLYVHSSQYICAPASVLQHNRQASKAIKVGWEWKWTLRNGSYLFYQSRPNSILTLEYDLGISGLEGRSWINHTWIEMKVEMDRTIKNVPAKYNVSATSYHSCKLLNFINIRRASTKVWLSFIAWSQWTHFW